MSKWSPRTATWGSKLAFAWLSLLGLTAVLAPWLPIPYSPDSIDLYATAVPPLVAKHWFGTDPYGRDVLARLLFGTRTTVFISFPAAVLATTLGTIVGGMAGFWGDFRLRLTTGPLFFGSVLAGGLLGFYGNWLLGLSAGLALVLLLLYYRRVATTRGLAVPLDSFVLGAVALLASIPRLILVLALTAVQPPSIASLLFILLLTSWIGPAQLVRSEMLRVRALPYIEAAYAAGLPPYRIFLRHALQNAWQPVFAAFPLSVAALVGLENTLSFLGVGLPPEVASWGSILAAIQVEPTAWWLVTFPALALLFTTLSLRLLGR